MADREVDFLLIGGGVASASCAAALRAGGAEGSILLVGRESDAPYERPPASKGYLRGEADRAAVALRPEAWWASEGIELATRVSAMKLDPEAREVRLSTKETVAYGQALVATGANVRRLRLDGAALEGIHYLRTLSNADAIRADALREDVARIVLVGGSYVACEVAASLSALGVACTIVMEEAAPLSRGFGDEVGAWVADELAARGVELVPGDPVERFAGPDGGRVEAVETRSGRRVDCGAVVMGTGATPDVMLARGAGLSLGETGGVACDARLRTSAEGVWAAGDVCEFRSATAGGAARRIEHWEVARAQGEHVAAGMLGAERPFETVPYFWCDLGDWATLEYVGGLGPAPNRTEVRGTVGDPAGFSVVYLADDRVVGALTRGRPGDLAALLTR